MSAAPSWLAERRWFGGKGARISRVHALDQAQLTPGLVFVTLEVCYESGAVERYVVPLRPDAGFNEALADDAAVRALFDLVRDARTVKTQNGELRGERIGAIDLPREPAVRRLSAEQSNTSIVFGDEVILKLIRKLEPGVNPELEMGAFFARHGFKATPELLGALSLHGALEATVAVAHRFVRVESDGWSYVLDGFRRSDGDIFVQIRELGARIGEMHLALASDADDPAFAPEEITREDLARWSAQLEADVRRTAELARGAVREFPVEALLAQTRRLAGAAPGGLKIRQHGDLHLGQVLRSDGHWLVFDFEGEPARPLHERRMKHSPMKDVAGMLRSFAYAGATAAMPRAVQPAREAFLQGWQSAGLELSHELLTALELEKLLYELRYELGHRPDWVQIPARDLAAFA